MSSTTFSPGTTVTSSWLNDVNLSTYTTVPALVSGAANALQKGNNLSDVANATTARTNLGAAQSGANGDITSLTALTTPVSFIPSVQGAFKNLQASANGTTAAVNISVDELILENSSHVYTTLRNQTLTANTGGAVGINSLDTGAWAFNTWYYVFVVTGASGTGLLFSLSATAPTLPTGYTYFALVSAVRIQATTNYYPWAYKQSGRRGQWQLGSSGNMTSLPLMASGVMGTYVGSSANTLAAVATSLFVPPNASTIKFQITTTNVGTYLEVAPNSNYTGGYSSATAIPLFQNVVNAGGVLNSVIGEFLLESTYIYAVSNGSAAYLYAVGWEMNL